MTLAQQVSFNGETTIILIPAFNESMVVGAVIKEIKAHCNLPIVVIDDASTDNTVDVAQNAGATVIPLPAQLLKT